MNSHRFGLKSSDLENIIEALEQFENIGEAIIFGSRAKGNYRHGSDVDIAIKGNIDFKTLTHLSYLLNEEYLMPYKFDIVNYDRTNHHDLKEHIDRVGISIYHKDILVSA